MCLMLGSTYYPSKRNLIFFLCCYYNYKKRWALLCASIQPPALFSQCQASCCVLDYTQSNTVDVHVRGSVLHLSAFLQCLQAKLGRAVMVEPRLGVSGSENGVENHDGSLSTEPAAMCKPVIPWRPRCRHRSPGRSIHSFSPLVGTMSTSCAFLKFLNPNDIRCHQTRSAE